MELSQWLCRFFKEITGLPVYDFLSITYSSVQRPFTYHLNHKHSFLLIFKAIGLTPLLLNYNLRAIVTTPFFTETSAPDMLQRLARTSDKGAAVTSLP